MNPDLEDAGALVSATLAAGEIDRASWSRRDDGHPAKNCTNCGMELQGAYCHGCGQAGHLHRSLLHLFEEAIHGVTHFEAKGWRTLPLLIARPGLLTRRYIHGQRTSYVSPLSLFLFTVFLMFFIYSLTGGGTPTTAPGSTQAAEAKAELAKAAAEAGAEVARAESAVAEARRRGADVSDAEADLAAAKTAQRLTDMAAQSAISALPAAGSRPAEEKTDDTWQAQVAKLKVQTGFPDFDAKVQRQLANPELLLYRLKNTAYKLSFMLIPISLPFLWLMFLGKRNVAVYDHAVFSLYSLSFMSLLFAAAALLSAAGLGKLMALAVVSVPPIHMFLQLRETYQLGTFAALWRTVALLCVAGTAFTLFLVLIVMMNLH